MWKRDKVLKWKSEIEIKEAARQVKPSGIQRACDRLSGEDYVSESSSITNLQ